ACLEQFVHRLAERLRRRMPVKLPRTATPESDDAIEAVDDDGVMREFKQLDLLLQSDGVGQVSQGQPQGSRNGEHADERTGQGARRERVDTWKLIPDRGKKDASQADDHRPPP